MPLSCPHVGAREHQTDEFLRTLAEARRLDATVILLGDLIDNQVDHGTQHQGMVYEARMDPDEQIDEAVRLLRRVRVGRVIGGNHCERTKRAVGVHPEKVIADRLGVGFSPEVWSHRFDGKTFVFTHGNGSGDNDFRKVAQAYYGADCICIGHSHELSHKVVRRVNAPTGRMSNIHWVRCGCHLGYASYAKRALYGPTAVGYPLVRVVGGRIDVTVHPYE